MRSRQLGMSPAKIAMAVAVTMEAIAGTGSMKNVTGTRSAVAMVAVRPGTAPTNRPNAAEPRITHSTYGSSTSFRASKSILLEQAPRERNAQHLVERKMDRERGDYPDYRGKAPRSPEDPGPEREQQKAREMEAERVGGEDVEDEARDHAAHPKHRRASPGPRRQRDPGRTLAHAGDDEKRAANAERA